MKNRVMSALLAGSLVWGAFSVSVAQGALNDAGQEAEERSSSSSRKSIVKPNVKFSLPGNRDPMLSPDDILLLKHREKVRMQAEEADRRRREEEEKRRLAEEEKRRQWELMLIKDPTVLVRNQIRIDGLIDKEVLIGGKLYTVGNTYKGAKIVKVGADSVTFSYKGHKFVKMVKL